VSATVTVPLWLAILVGLAAAWAVYARIVVPGLRWFVRRRGERVLDEVGGRLRLEIRPFQQTRRQALIDVLVHDARVQAAAAAHAREQGLSRDVVTRRLRDYAREIVPAFNAYFYFRLGYRIGRWLTRSLYRVRIGYSDSDGLARIPASATVVFVMNHRSNMDRYDTWWKPGTGCTPRGPRSCPCSGTTPTPSPTCSRDAPRPRRGG
jgi:glycerol-3-phosphate O-acyltransferase